MFCHRGYGEKGLLGWGWDLQLSLGFAIKIGKKSTAISLPSTTLFSALMTGPCYWLLEVLAFPGRAIQGSHHAFTPRPSSYRELSWLLEAPSLFLPVHCPTPGVQTCSSSCAQIPRSDVLVCSLGVFLLSFRCSVYCCFKGRNLGTSLTLLCF